MSKSDYLRMTNKLLEDGMTYKILKNNPTLEFLKELGEHIKKAKDMGILNEKESLYLSPNNPRIPLLYCLPKIHKNLIDPPGRPIVSGINSITSNLSEYIDFYLQEYVKCLPSYLRDSTDVLRILDEIKWEDNFLLATCDVSALYTCIKHEDGLEAVSFYLDRDEDLLREQKCFIEDSIKYILTHNYFHFDGQYFLQQCGTAMGTRFAPSYANLFMGLWEHIFLDSVDLGANLVLYRRYIDDILVVWRGSKEDLEWFFSRMNANEKNLKFTYEISDSKINFLDLEITIQDGIVLTKTFFKPVDANGYIHADSCHLDRWKNNIPKSQLMRIRKNCKVDNDFMEQSDLLENKFLERGYDPILIKKAKDEVLQMNRKDLLAPKIGGRKIKYKEGGSFLPFITQYSDDKNKLEKILRKHWHILKTDDILGPLIPPYPQVVYRKCRNLKTILAPTDMNKKKDSFNIKDRDLRGNKLSGFFPCLSCKACKHSKKSKVFISNVTKKEYKIKNLHRCSDSNIVYLIQCLCGIQYVGESVRPVRDRIREHINSIENMDSDRNKDLPVPRHFRHCNKGNLKHFSYMIIDQVKPNWRGCNIQGELLRLEAKWIYELKTLAPKGLNLDFDLGCFL